MAAQRENEKLTKNMSPHPQHGGGGTPGHKMGNDRGIGAGGRAPHHPTGGGGGGPHNTTKKNLSQGWGKKTTNAIHPRGRACRACTLYGRANSGCGGVRVFEAAPASAHWYGTATGRALHFESYSYGTLLKDCGRNGNGPAFRRQARRRCDIQSRRDKFACAATQFAGYCCSREDTQQMRASRCKNRSGFASAS